MIYSRWTPASLPTEGDLDEGNRGPLLWYNPYDRVQRTSIWPGQRDQVEARNEQTDVLTLKVTPPAGAGLTTWGGVMTVFSGAQDLSQSKFVGIWLRGQSGRLHLDLGDISEDWIPNGRIDTEDVPLQGRAIGDGTLAEEEDTGIDGRTDHEELDYYLTRETEVTAQELEGLTFAEKRSRYGELIRALGRDPNDAEGDDWDYDPTRDRHNYTRYNGTEGNRRVREQPDTEDLNNDGNLNQRNDYYHYEIDLALDPHEPGTCSEPPIGGQCRGWRLFRLRLFDESVRRVGSPDSSRIEYARFLFDTESTPGAADSVVIARVEIPVNQWQGEGVSRYDEEAYEVTEGEIFEVDVIGTDENLAYRPPPGVKGQRSRTSRCARAGAVPGPRHRRSRRRPRSLGLAGADGKLRLHQVPAPAHVRPRRLERRIRGLRRLQRPGAVSEVRPRRSQLLRVRDAPLSGLGRAQRGGDRPAAHVVAEGGAGEGASTPTPGWRPRRSTPWSSTPTCATEPRPCTG